MKCFVVVNQLNNPVFLDFDTEFTRFIHQKAVEVGLFDPDQPENNSGEVDVAVVTQLFSPLVLSQVPLDDQVHNPCTSIQCPNGMLLVFKKVDDIQYITISGDGSATEDFLARKIMVFIRIIKFLFGPVFTELANCGSTERAARWSYLRHVLHTWERLATNDQSFLVEAVERLHVNQVVSEKCVSLLEKTVRKMQSDQPTQHAFLLVNNKLLALYSERSTFELQPADILLMTLLAQDMFPTKDALQDLLANTGPAASFPPHPQPSTHKDKDREDEGEGEGEGDAGRMFRGDSFLSDDNEDEFHSAPNTPSQRSPTPGTQSDTRISLNPPVTIPHSDHHSLDQTGEGLDRERGGEGDDGGLERLTGDSSKGTGSKASTSASRDSTTTSSSAVETEYPLLSPHASGLETPMPVSAVLSGKRLIADPGRSSRGSNSDGRISTSQGAPSDRSSATPREISGSVTGQRSRSGTDHSERSNTTQTSVSGDYFPQSVFLQTPGCPHAPHALHCAQVLPGITLVVVSQMLAYTGADPLCQVLVIVQDLLQGRRNKLSREQALNVHSVVVSLLKKVHNIVKKMKKSASKSSADVLSRWESAEMNRKLLAHLQEEETTPMPPDLESPLMELQRRLKDLFQQLYVLCGSTDGGGGAVPGREVIAKTRVKLQQELMDYRDYLSVKAQRNITMTSYLDDYPGLIHFIYIDRQYHQVTAPSFNIIPDHGKADATVFLKKKIWSMYSQMMKKLQQGYTTVLLREGDFYYSYFLWFEDSMNNQVPVDEPFRPTLSTPLPGTLTGNFYRRLMRQCFPDRVDGAVHCCEMFMMHIGLVTPQYIANHCLKLSRKLWEMTGEAYRPVNLL